METRICTSCNLEKALNEFYYHKQRKLYMATCKKCNTIKKRAYDKKIKDKDLLKYQLRNRAGELVRRAKYKKLPYEKKMFKTLVEIYEKQNNKCYYTGIEMSLNGFSKNDNFCFVVDRINPDEGYIKGNMVFCCNAVNRIKSNFSFDELKWWINKIHQL